MHVRICGPCFKVLFPSNTRKKPCSPYGKQQLCYTRSGKDAPCQGSCWRIPLNLRLLSPCQVIWAKAHMPSSCSPPPCLSFNIIELWSIVLASTSEVLTHHIITALGLGHSLVQNTRPCGIQRSGKITSEQPSLSEPICSSIKRW